jgi:hypothetical protein
MGDVKSNTYAMQLISVSRIKSLVLQTHKHTDARSYARTHTLAQALVRGFLCRVSVATLRQRLSQQQGVLLAVDGTVQGRTGWYAQSGLFFFFQCSKDEVRVGDGDEEAGTLFHEEPEQNIILFSPSLQQLIIWFCGWLILVKCYRLLHPPIYLCDIR